MKQLVVAYCTKFLLIFCIMATFFSGEGPAHIGSCNPYCAYQCMSNCNPMCCSTKIATNAVGPTMANMILQRQMALMQRRNGFSPRIGMNQRPCVPSPMNRCMPNGMQNMPFNQVRNRDILKVSFQVSDTYQA